MVQIMRRLLFNVAIAGLLLSSGVAFSQDNQPRSGSGGTSTTQTQSGDQSKQSGERRSGERRDGGERSERRASDRGSVTVRGGDREGTRVREGRDRRSVNVRVRGDRDDFRYRHRHRGVGVYVGGCRTIVVKKHYHHRTIIKRIRRCG
jgi:hypothetical protein